MTPKPSTASRPCGPADARTRLAQARKFLEVATLCLEDPTDDSGSQVAAALAVLAGIAASDAACCAGLKKRPRGQDHHEAEALVATLHPHGAAAAKNLARLLNEKDNAHYGLFLVSRSTATKMLDWAGRLVDFAEETLTV